MFMPTVFHENLFDDLFDPFWNGHQLDHRLAAIARLCVHVLEQQQRGGAAAFEDFTPFGLLVEQRHAQMLLEERT